MINIFRSQLRLNQLSNQMQRSVSDTKKKDILFQQITPYMTSVRLNKPSTLNALNMDMISLLRQELVEWNNSQTVLTYFSGEGKAFCAGGDIKSLYEAKQSQKQEDKKILTEFFRQEFEVDYMIAKMKPIQLCIYDGIVMGGGVGISIHSPIKIATEQSMFAMPEASIGFFTDIGSSYFLPRLRNKIGYYLAMTGQRLKGKQLVQAGVATHFIKSENINSLQEELENTVNSCSNIESITSIVQKYQEQVDVQYQNEDQIQEIFNYKDFQEFIINLKKQVEKENEIAIEIQQKVQKQSPLSLRVIHEQLNKGETMTLEECLKMDFRITQSFMQGNEFFEGVRCTLIDRKDTPKWKYQDPLQISQTEIDSYFEMLPSEQELVLNTV